jgi:uncharacterized protein YbaP (TraB family)
MTDVLEKKEQFEQPSSTVCLSRRQVMLGLGLAVFAASSWSKLGWAAAPSNWPLWTVEGRGGKIFLTGETPARRIVWNDARIEGLLQNCSALWTETNLNRHQDVQVLIKQYGIDESKPLLSKLTERDQSRLAEAVKLAQVPLDSVAQYRPWFAAFTVEQAYYAAMNLPEAGTAEKVLMPMAQKNGITVSSEFPAIDDLVAFMGESSPTEDVQYLQYTLDHILDGAAKNEQVYSRWARGDMSGAEQMVARMKTSQPAMYDKHVIGRNGRWVPRIDEMLKSSKPALVVVGLYHVAGPDSVLARLREHGLKVTAV